MNAPATIVAAQAIDQPADRDTWLAMRRGFMFRCPACGEGKLYTGYLKDAE